MAVGVLGGEGDGGTAGVAHSSSVTVLAGELGGVGDGGMGGATQSSVGSGVWSGSCAAFASATMSLQFIWIGSLSAWCSR